MLIFNLFYLGTNFDSDNKCFIRANTSLLNGPRSTFNQFCPNILPATSKCTYLNFAHLSNKSFKYYLSSWKHFSTLLIYQSFFDFDLRGKVSTRSKLRNSLLIPIYIVIRSVLYYYKVSCNLRLPYKYPDLLDIIIQVFHPWFTWPLIWIFRLTELDSTCCYILQDIYGNMNIVYLMLSIWNLGFLAAIQKSFVVYVLSFANICIRSRSIGGVPGEIISDKGCNLKACNYELNIFNGDMIKLFLKLDINCEEIIKFLLTLRIFLGGLFALFPNMKSSIKSFIYFWVLILYSNVKVFRRSNWVKHYYTDNIFIYIFVLWPCSYFLYTLWVQSLLHGHLCHKRISGLLPDTCYAGYQ